MTTLKAWMGENDVSIPSLIEGKGEHSMIAHIGPEDGFSNKAKLLLLSP